MELIWLIFLLIAFQPVVRQKMLMNARYRLIGKLESLRKSRVIVLIHRQERMNFLGFPVVKYIDINDAEEILRACELTDPDMPIDLIIHTPGGLVLAAMQIAKALRRHPGKVTVFVPHYAMSGGTLIALAADEIVMSPHAVLGPIDPQVGTYPAASLLKVTQEKPIDEIDDQTLIFADVAKKAMAQLEEGAKYLLTRTMSEEKASQVARSLVEGNWTHDFPITVEMAQSLGLKVSTTMPKEIFELMALYPQPVRYMSTVEYIPSPKYQNRH